MVVIGLGKAGCSIAEMFKSDNNYKVFTYDGGKNVPLNESSEGYENGFPNKRELKKIKNETVWFFVCGAGKIAGGTLRLLEQIKENKINIVYIVPDTSILPDTAKKRNRVTAGVLQQYARSGLFNAIYLVANNSLEQIVGEAPLASYYSKMNELIFNCVHSMNVFAHTDPVFGQLHEPKEISRIRTFSFIETNKNEKKLFFPLDNITETCYINNIKKSEIEKNSNLISEIKSRLDKDVISSFTVYQSPYEHSYAYGIHYTHYIQEV
jgi:hypothetical protein